MAKGSSSSLVRTASSPFIRRPPPPSDAPSDVHQWREQKGQAVTSKLPNGVLFFLFSCCNLLTMYDALFSFYLLSFLVFTAGISGRSAGIILLITESFNVFVGPLASVIMEKYYPQRFGKHRFWISILSVPLAISFISLWWTPPGTFEGRTAYHLISILLFNVFYGTTRVAYEGMIPLMASEKGPLQQLNSYRLFIGSFGGIFALLVTTFVGPFIASRFSDQIEFIFTSMILAFILLSSYVTFTFFTSESHQDNLNEHSDVPLSFSMEREDSSNSSSDSDDMDMDDVKVRLTKQVEKTDTTPHFRSSLKSLFQQKRFVVMIFNHFFLWMVIILTEAPLDSYVSSYLRLTLPIGYLGAGNLSILVHQIGCGISQVLMGILPDRLKPKLMVRVGLVIVLICKLLISFAFEPGYLPPVWILPVFALDGIGIGALFVSYEVMVPEIILHDHFTTLVPKENIIYGVVDGIRELSLALSFFFVGLYIEEDPSSDANVGSNNLRVLCGFVPIAGIVCLTILHAIHPHIQLNDEAEEKKEGGTLGAPVA